MDFDLLNTQIETIKEAEDVKERNAGILNTVQLLLDSVEYDDEILAGYEKIEMRKLFSAFCKATTAACAFFENAKGFLDPDAEKGRLGKEIIRTTQELEHISEMTEENERNESKLLSKQAKLQEKKAKYDELINTINRLKEIQETVSDDKMHMLKRNIKEMNIDIENRKNEIAWLEKQLSAAINMQGDVESIFVNVSNEDHRVESNILDVIERNYSELNQIYEKQNKCLSDTKSSIENYITRFKIVSDEVAGYSDVLKNYELCLGENSEIVAAMEKNGISSLNEFNENISNIKASIEQGLSQYSRMLRSVILEEEKAREKIAHLQNKR